MSWIQDSTLGNMPKDCTVDVMVKIFNTTLKNLADRFALPHVIRTKGHLLEPMLNEECRTARRKCRNLERRYKRTWNETDWARWVEAMRTRRELFQTKKNYYWVQHVQADKSPTRLWWPVSQLLVRKTITEHDMTAISADMFADFSGEGWQCQRISWRLPTASRRGNDWGKGIT